MPATAGTPGASRPRVLVVEDYPDASETLCVLLDFWGYDVRPCGTVAEARVAVEAFRPHAALLDIRLPDADGVELAREFLARDAPPVVAIVSGSATPADRQRAADAGVADFFAKPADPGALRRFLDSRLGARLGEVNWQK
jgi:DNA-binding response OmpR family regulator